MKRTILLSILAMSLGLAASHAARPAGINGVEKYHRPAQEQVYGGGLQAVPTDSFERQIPVQSSAPGKTDREKQPLLIAPGQCPVCRLPALSSWERFQLLLPLLYWI